MFYQVYSTVEEREHVISSLQYRLDFCQQVRLYKLAQEVHDLMQHIV
jgi:hypothetical protein